jgi:glycine betaine/proline transport system permease protein
VIALLGPRIHIGQWTSDLIDWLTVHWAGFFNVLSDIFTFLVQNLSDALLGVPPLVMLLILVLLAWTVRSWRFGVFSLVALWFIQAMDQWDNAMMTLSLVVVATVIAVVISLPIGILAASNQTASAITKPVLDFMQTMPAMVYLIPAVTFFSIGVAPGLISTIIFALPPGVRLTELGIRQVPSETVEAGHAFGASRRQILFGIQLPLAVPTIMAGVNQVIMLALSMAVIAGMVGADGLGKEVVSSLSTLNIAQGVEAGLGVVVLAIFLDRITAALGDKSLRSDSLVALIRRARTA